MRTRINNLLFSLLLFSSNLFAGEIAVLGKVIAHSNQKPLSGCSVFNSTKNIGTMTDHQGFFLISASPEDEIQIRFIGFEMHVLDLTQIKDTPVIVLKNKVRELRSVRIRAVPNARNSIIYNPEYEKRDRRPPVRDVHRLDEYTNPLTSFNSPITAMYYAFSVKAQRKLWAIEKLEKKRITELKYTNEFIGLILNTHDEEVILEARRNCSLDEDFILSATFYELGVAIRNCYVSSQIKSETHSGGKYVSPEADYDEY